MTRFSRRDLLRTAALGAGSALAGGLVPPRPAPAQERGDRPNRPDGVAVLNPLGRVPVSFIIDDSTCLVNLAHFAIPQFAQVFPDQYKQPWKELPREIPDRFVRRFGEWCGERGIKGKYSIVPYPACVGWLDRDLPGWSRRELDDSLGLVRELMLPNWDIHPEMVSHTWVVDTKTGRPYPEKSDRFMENWRWTDGKSADQIADYLAYALRVLKNVGLPCEGITTPGGFGNRVLPALSQASFQACRDVFGAEIPHYFRHLYTDDTSVAPRVEYASGLDTDDPRCVVSIIGCTGDWFGGWDGLERGTVEQFITEDGKGGRLPEVIARGEPAILVCHWPGIYFNGQEVGFQIFQEVVRLLEEHHPTVLWMKLSEIARYAAARELTAIEATDGGVRLRAPYACPRFTLRLAAWKEGVPVLRGAGQSAAPALREVAGIDRLDSGTWHRAADGTLTVCIDLPRGPSTLTRAPAL
jgi:hypothetical protein